MKDGFMNKKLICSLLCLNGICWANVEPYASPLLRGEMSVRSADGSWKKSVALEPGQWAQSKSGNTTISVPGAVIRAESGAKVRYTLEDGKLHLDASGGRVFVSMQPGAERDCTISVAKKQIHVSKGEFVIDSDAGLVTNVNAAASPAKWQRQGSSLAGSSVGRASNLIRQGAAEVLEAELAFASAEQDSTFSGEGAVAGASVEGDSSSGGEQSNDSGGDDTLLYAGIGVGMAGLLALLLSNNNNNSNALAPSSP
jgi:hypothetical protein